MTVGAEQFPVAAIGRVVAVIVGIQVAQSKMPSFFARPDTTIPLVWGSFHALLCPTTMLFKDSGIRSTESFQVKYATNSIFAHTLKIALLMRTIGIEA